MTLTERMKRFLLGAALASGLALPAQAESVTLTYSNWLPPSYPLHTDLILPWIEEVERVTEGRVKIALTPKVVGSVLGQYDVAADGLADIALITPSYTPGRFPLVEGLELPFYGDDLYVRSPASWRTYEKFIAPTGQFEDVVVLTLFLPGVGQPFSKNLDLSRLENWRGAKLRTYTPILTQMIELLGGVPISKPASEVYELVSAGQVDGAVTPPDSLLAFKLDTLLNRMVEVQGGFVTSTIILVMNPDAWDRLSAEDQAAVMSVSGEALALKAGELLRRLSGESLGKLEAAGMAIDRPTPEATAQMMEIVAPVREQWIERAKAAGMEDPQAMLDFLAEQTGMDH